MAVFSDLCDLSQQCRIPDLETECWILVIADISNIKPVDCSHLPGQE